jgi:NhaA family Na+:H+ antiporter
MAAVSTIREFFRMEGGGSILVLASALALIVANSPLHNYYELLLGLHLQIRLDAAGIDKPLLCGSTTA